MKPKIGNTRVVVLAAGKGTRMQSELPKVLLPIKGKPILRHVVEAINQVFSMKPVLITGYKSDLVRKEFSNEVDYALQREQLGTAHAVACAKSLFENSANVIVLPGDHPYTSKESLKKLEQKHLTDQNTITVATIKVDNFSAWRGSFTTNGRIIRQNGKLVAIKEYRDTSEAEKKIKELNVSIYMFDTQWLLNNISKIKNDNLKKEYYITDMLSLAAEQNKKIGTLQINAVEALGANTKEELAVLEGVNLEDFIQNTPEFFLS